MEKISDEQLKREFDFDQYGRYAIIRDVINKNRKGEECFSVLDVGGRGNIMRKFLPNDDVFYLDPFVDSDDENFIKGDGCAIPLKEESFDWVSSSDVFEHISKEKRERFLEENLRVAKLGVILVAPFYSKEVAQVEFDANENYKIISGGKEHIWLKEHIQNGLPDMNELEKFLEIKQIKFQKLYNNRLSLWQTLTNVNFLISENFHDSIKKELEDFNYFYNTKVFPFDNQEPSYRKVYFIKKDYNLKNIEIEKKWVDDSLFLAAVRNAFGIVNKINNLNKEFILQKDQQVLNFNQITQQKDQEIENLTSSKFWKLRERYVKIRGIGTVYLRDLFLKALLVLIKNGPKKFLIYTYKYFVYGRRYFKQELDPLVQKYHLWIEKNERWDKKEIIQEIKNFKKKPKISIITPVYNVDPKWLDACIQSVVGQLYHNWELCLYDDASKNKKTIKCLKKWEGKDDRIKIRFGKVNQHISGSSNEALKMATGEFIALLDNDDEISPNALFEIAKLINNHPKADLIYSDEDKLDMIGQRMEPFFKPDFSPNLLLSMNYISHLGIYRKDIVHEIGGFRKGFEGSQDHDLVLRFIEKIEEKNIFHISKILYHWRKIPGSTADNYADKSYAFLAGKKALEDHLKRKEIKATVINGYFPGAYQIKRVIENKPKVSIIIPFKDQVDVLKLCINSIAEKTTYKNYELILIDNQSEKSETLEYLRSLGGNNRISVLQYDHAFNFSAINNFAVKQAKGDYVLFLNNDTEVISKKWLSALLEEAQGDDVGAVGAKLLYPNNLVQHAGVVMGLGIAGHAFRCLEGNDTGYFGFPMIVRNYSAVTGACLLTKKSIFEEVGGFDEKNLAIAYNDVDLCLKMREKGYRIIFTPYAELYHHESLSRGNDEDLRYSNPEKYKRVIAEREYMQKKWSEIIENDPYYNPNLTKTKEDFSLNII